MRAGSNPNDDQRNQEREKRRESKSGEKRKAIHMYTDKK
jgi:hypothetical protein